MLRKLLRVLNADELLVIGSADVDQGPDGLRAVGGLEWSVMYAVAVDLANIEILLNFGNLFRLYPVGYAPYFLWRRVMVVVQLLPE